MINLYPDQLEFVDRIRGSLRTSKSVLGVAPTGMGKTVVSAYIAASAARKNKTVWFVCHRKNLLAQTSKAFWDFKIEHGLIASGRAMSPLLVQVALIGTLANRLERLKAPDLLILDECHLAMSPSWLTVVEWCKARGSTIIGNSATPERLDGKGLEYIFDDMVESENMGWLIDNKRLSDYVMYSGSVMPDMSNIKTRAGEYRAEDMATEMSRPKLIGDAGDHWEKHAPGKRTILFAASINHSMTIVEALNHRGIPAVHVDGETPDADIKAAINGFADGKYKIMSNVALMTTGFDLSAQVGRDVPIEACSLMRGTKSLALYLQMVGRAMRYKDYPAVLLDHAGCAMEHGLPDDIREWSLAGREKSKRGPQDALERAVTCAGCGAIYRPDLRECPVCGSEAIRGARRDAPEQVDGELLKIQRDRQIRENKQQQGASRSLDDLIKIGMTRGINRPDGWAANIISARKGKKPGPADFNAARAAYVRIRGQA